MGSELRAARGSHLKASVETVLSFGSWAHGIQRFLRAGLIQRLIISRVPVLIGSGIPLFGSLPRDIPLRHIATRQYQGGLVQSGYDVAV